MYLLFHLLQGTSTCSGTGTKFERLGVKSIDIFPLLLLRTLPMSLIYCHEHFSNELCQPTRYRSRVLYHRHNSYYCYQGWPLILKKTSSWPDVPGKVKVKVTTLVSTKINCFRCTWKVEIITTMIIMIKEAPWNYFSIMIIMLLRAINWKQFLWVSTKKVRYLFLV